MDQLLKSEAYLELVAITVAPFVLEYQGNFEAAIHGHDRAAKFLGEFLTRYKKFVGKFHRKMFERQATVHSERKGYLESFKGSFKGVIVPPTIRSADDEMVVGEGQARTLSLDNRELANCLKMNGDSDHEKAPSSIKHLLGPEIPLFTPTLDSSLPPTVYRISHSSELVFLGQRAHWLYVKDESNTQTLWAMHCLWQDNAPIVHALLRRAGEFLPGAGAILVNILKTPGGAFNLKMSTTEDITVLEKPDRGAKTKDWSPRRFTYGGRKFVWKMESDGGMWARMDWETLYEYSRAWPKEGSQTGKMEDEIVGDRLCWGEKGGGKGVEGTIYFKEGLDQKFREHCLASQLGRYCRVKWPSNKDTKGVEAASGASALLSLISLASG